ncbi:hypothetical protein HG537_0C05790 [Torulaspora globosa]|uniref:Lysophospholipase NTE1 n=1 Tax=Torulaspora globosa TaxID=48254 RepID=A0A7H9HRF2_9SACH|nr:hypothetical protein HG537_0C05790 [Torulaspora sp. CBS 2947]
MNCSVQQTPMNGSRRASDSQLQGQSQDSSGSQSQEGWVVGLFNFTWVVSYFLVGCTVFITKWSVYLVTFCLLHVPRWIFIEASKLHLTISFPTFLILATLTAYVIYCAMKGNVFAQYKRLIPDEIGDSGYSEMINRSSSSKKMSKEKSSGNRRLLLDESNDSREGASHLDQFLSAIKIFGYLEKPVFHDLTKNMRTQKLDEGEILLLDDSIGFAIVVEGTLQIYHRVEQESSFGEQLSKNGSLDETLEPFRSCTVEEQEVQDYDDLLNGEHGDGSAYIRLKDGLGKFQLLNTMKPGNPVSSLVNILNLFTSTYQEFDWQDAVSRSPSVDVTVFQSGFNGFSESAKKDVGPISSPTAESLPTSNLGSRNTPPVRVTRVIARAATDCTIAIIPPQAFANLTAKYPRSASHIIQMILTRLYRVTFQTANDYLGLTREIMNMEVVLNKNVNFDLPFYLKDAVIRLVNNQSSSDSFESKTAIKSESKSMTSSSLESRSKAKKAPERPQLRSVANYQSSSSVRGSRHVVLGSRDHLNPGDLLSSVPLSRKESPGSSATMPQNKLSSPLSSQSQKIMAPSSSDSSSGNSRYSMHSFLSQGLASPVTMKLNVNDSSLSGLESGLKNDDVKNWSFSAAQEETEESALRMALVEAMFTYLGINRDNMAMPSSPSSNASHEDDHDKKVGNFNTRNNSIIATSSSASLSSYLAPPSAPLRILPSDYAITSQKQKPKKKQVYREEVSPNLDYDSAKDEFSQGIEIHFFKKGTVLVEQNHKGKGLFYIVSGKIDVTAFGRQPDGQSHFGSARPSGRGSGNKETVLFTIGAGGVAGYLSSLIGYKSFVNLKARTDVYVGFLPNRVLERLCNKYFMIYLRIAETLTSLLSPKMLKFDHALEWIQLSASETLFRQGDPANGIYLVLNGRLRQLRRKIDTQYKGDDAQNSLDQNNSHSDSNSDLEIVNELAQGESFGEVEVLTAMNRVGTMVSVRDSELARIPRTLFELLALEHPSIMIRVSRLVAKKVLGSENGEPGSKFKTDDDDDFSDSISQPRPMNVSYTHNPPQLHSSCGKITYRTLTILPITGGLPVEDFAMKLVQAFKKVDRSTIGLNQRTALSHLGRHAFDRLAQLKKSGYFAELEEMYDTVVYIADTPVNSSWTKTCIAQADCVLLLADAAASPDIGEFERLLLNSRTTARTELILLHPDRYVDPGSTHKWLRFRGWVDSHHHIQMAVNPLRDESDSKHGPLNSGPFGLVDKLIQTEFSKRTQQNISKLVPDSIKTRMETFSSKFKDHKKHYYSTVHAHKSDFLRLARILSGQAIGLVLGGGGARGISHLGFLQAIEEQGIPIDMIGGTSIGSFVGGLYARDYDLVPIYGRVKKFAGRIASIWRMMADLTWPVTSYTTGHEFNRGIWKAFGDARIEDFWIQYYCNSTNITESVQEIHSFGYAWRYIRASMSLAGLLPPLEDKGSMLLDGGYLDNLPVWEMKARGCNTIFAVDVGSVDDRTPMDYGDSLNGFWIVLNRWNPFSPHPNIPNMAEIQMRLGYVASVNALERAKRTPGVIYARPPIEDYATLDFGKFKEIYEIGAQYGNMFLTELQEQNKMPYIPGSRSTSTEDELPEFLLHRRNSI